VLEATARIPYGSVSSYKRVATEASSPAGVARRRQRVRIGPAAASSFPCYGVLHTGGGRGGCTGGLERKRKLLQVEGWAGIALAPGLAG
jgi:O6-methylguanine-DNA--protein-cysteine methyltransferase